MPLDLNEAILTEFLAIMP
jgi:hypothetical protein